MLQHRTPRAITAAVAALWAVGGATAPHSGTGIALDATGHVLTSQHVAGNCHQIWVEVDAQRFQAQLIAQDAQRDLALLRAESSLTATPAQLRLGQAVQLGERITLAGYPLPSVFGRQLTLGHGIVSALSNPEGRTDWLQISAPVQLGHSGGPLLDQQGFVIGLVTGKLNALQVLNQTGDLPQNVNFAVSISGIEQFLRANKGVIVPASADPTPPQHAPPAHRVVGDAVLGYTVYVECQDH